MTTPGLDELSIAVIWGRLVAVAEEMGTIVRSTAYSEAVREGRDFSTGVFDVAGQLLAQADLSPGHLGAMPFAVENLLSAYPRESLRPGDVIATNDPYLGSGHLPDFYCLTPVFAADELCGFCVASAHMIDVGGMKPGSQAVQGVTELFQEGIRVPPVRLFNQDGVNAEVLRTIEANVRVPEKVSGDLRALRNALHVGAAQLASMTLRYGRSSVTEAARVILDRSEAAVRNELTAMPQGTYRFSDTLDDRGPGTDPVHMEVSVTIGSGQMRFDFAGSDPQTESAINSPVNFTRAYCYWAAKAVTTGNSIPQNAGQLRPIEVVAPPGSFFNPLSPAAAGGRAVLNQRIVELLFGALFQAVPGRVSAASGQWSNPTFGGVDPRTGLRFVFYDYTVGGVGARRSKDGVSAMSPVFSLENIPVEVQEANYPVRVERIELIVDSGGAGRTRGGLSIRKDIRVLADNVELSNLTDRQRVRPYGLDGGEAGSLGEIVLNPGNAHERLLQSKGSYRLRDNDVVSFRCSGSGGYGSPHERERAAVRRDVVEGYVSQDAALTLYGLAVGDTALVGKERRVE
jgi:N-methylhydantoinase B